MPVRCKGHDYSGGNALMTSITVSLNDQIKNFLVGLLKDSVTDLKHSWAPLAANLAIGGLTLAPFIGLVVGGAYTIEKLVAGHSDLGLLSGVIMMAIGLLFQFAMISCFIGFLSVFIKVARGRQVKATEVLSGRHKILTYLGAYLVAAPLVILGMLCFILPGYYIALRLSMLPMVIADGDVGPIEAVKRCFAVTKGREFEMLTLIVLFVPFFYAFCMVSMIPAILLPFLPFVTVAVVGFFFQFIMAKYYVSIAPEQPEAIETSQAPELSPAPCAA